MGKFTKKGVKFISSDIPSILGSGFSTGYKITNQLLDLVIPKKPSGIYGTASFMSEREKSTPGTRRNPGAPSAVDQSKVGAELRSNGDFDFRAQGQADGPSHPRGSTGAISHSGNGATGGSPPLKRKLSK